MEWAEGRKEAVVAVAAVAAVVVAVVVKVKDETAFWGKRGKRV